MRKRKIHQGTIKSFTPSFKGEAGKKSQGRKNKPKRGRQEKEG